MGYIYNRMSEGAQEAYRDGEMPLSKWTKEDIIDGIHLERSSNQEDLEDDLRRLTKQELVNHFLRRSSWHHTGPYFSRTDFYSVDGFEAEQATKEKIEEIIKARGPKVKRPRKPKAPKVKPTYITALLEFNVTIHERRYYYSERVQETAQYMSDQKMVYIQGYGNKRLSACRVIRSIEQKTRFADERRLKKA